MKKLDWYFDFVSPFSYLQFTQLDRLPADTEIRYVPVLFAGLLRHWGQLGPAEISPKRTFTYRHVQWLASRYGIEYNAPPMHPFNPLAALRLCIALRTTRGVIDSIFRSIWINGNLPDDADGLRAIAAELGVTDTTERIAALEIKERLISHTNEAISRGVFGVPTFVLEQHLFWGLDAFDFLLDCLADPRLLESEEMQRASILPIGVERERSG